MDKKQAEQFKAYQELLDVMENSKLISSMPVKDKNFIKTKYIHSPAEDINFAIDEIKAQEANFLAEKEAAVNRLNESQKKLEDAVNEAEQYLQTK